MRYLKISITLAAITAVVAGLLPALVNARATVQNTSMPDATVGQAYSLQFTAVTDDPPVTFQKWYWTYPGNEMSLSPSGVFSGTPTQAGIWEVGLRVEDGTGQGVYAVFSWKVNASNTNNGANTLTFTTDTSINGPVPAGAPNFVFAAFNVRAGQTPVTLTSLRAVSDSASNAHFSNITLFKDGAQVGSSASVLGNVSGSTRYAIFTFSPALTIPANTTAVFEVRASLSSQIPSGQVRLGLDGPQFSGTAPTITPSLPIYGNNITVNGTGGSGGNATLTATVTPGACNATTAAVLVTVTGTAGTTYTVQRNGGTATTITGSGTYNDSVAIGATQTYALFANNAQIGTSQSVTGSRQSNCGAGGTVTITTGETLPEGTVGQSYTQTLTATGGTAPYTWSVTSGNYSLYPCCYVQLNSNGTFSALPNATAGYLPFAGAYQLPVTVVDAAGVSAQKVFQFNVRSAVNPTPTPTPTPTVTPTPTPTPTSIGPVRNEGYIDALSATTISGWAYTSVPRQDGGPNISIVFENVSSASQTFTLNLKPTITRTDVATYLQNKYGLTNITIPTGFTGNPSSVITTNGTYRIKTATYDGLSFVLSDAAKRSFTVGGTNPGNLSGKYVKVDGDQTVYWIAPWGGKMPMLSAQVFASYGGKFEDVMTIAQEVLDDTPDVEYIKRANDARVYKIENGVKRYITPAAATRLNVDPAHVVTVNATEFFSYRTGSTIQ